VRVFNRPGSGRDEGEGEAMKSFWIACMATMVAACQQNPKTETAVASSPRVKHYYLDRDEVYFFYQVGAKPSDKQNGIAASDVVKVRFRGQRDGVYFLEEIEGASAIEASCNNPCKVIALSKSEGGETQKAYVAYNPGSIIGGAFYDAFLGSLGSVADANHADDIYQCAYNKAVEIIRSPTASKDHIASQVIVSGCNEFMGPDSDQLIKDAIVLHDAVDAATTRIPMVG
jgi:hypothetical protein